jgi:predicted MFS family arabinose efflux permease
MGSAIEPEASRGMPSPSRVLVGGMLGLAVAMGIGRFAFTPILPAMQRDTGLSHLMAGQLASWNYLGYLAGSLGLTLFIALRRSRALYPGALAASCFTTVAMGLTASPVWWGVWRFVGGMASSLVFIALAALVIPYLIGLGKAGGTSLLFSGVGLGIAFTGAMTPLLDRMAGWRGGWIGLGAVAALLSLLSWRLIRGIHSVPFSAAAVPAGRAPIRMLVAAYFLEGLGYVVTATFLVTIVRSTSGMAGWAAASWIVVGLSAAPSTVIWQALSHRFGWRGATTAAYLLQAGSLFVSTRAAGPVGILFSAAAFGGTFMGITSLSMGEGARRSGANQSHTAAILTMAFALGQIVGPVCAGWLAQSAGSFRLSLGLAGGCVLVGGILTWLDRPGLQAAP